MGCCIPKKEQIIEARKCPSILPISPTKSERKSDAYGLPLFETDFEKQLIIENNTIKILSSNLIFENKNKIEDKYKIFEQIGKGSYGSIYKVQNKQSKFFRAMKIIKKSCISLQDDEQKFLKEIEILMECDHPNIIKIFEYFVDEIYYIIITEYVGGGDLYTYISNFTKFSEAEIAGIMFQIFSAICYLHSKKIVHRDIKPENILVEKTKEKYDKDQEICLKLIDFGTSNYLGKSGSLSMKIGSPYYIAPEVLSNDYNEKCDLWSCGVLMYILLTGKPPFFGKSIDEIMSNVQIGTYDSSDKIFNNISTDAKELVKLLLTYDYKERISAEDALKSNWIQEYRENKFKLGSENKESILKNIKSFNAKEKLQHATLAYIVHFLGATEEVRSLKKIFRSIDTSGDGRLTYDELKNGFVKIFGESISEIELDKIITNIDQDKNGYIEYEEFLRATMNREILLSDKNLKIAFDNFDKNNDGKLGAEEIKSILGLDNDKYFDDLIKKVDTDNSGEINFNVFSLLMKEISKMKAPLNSSNSFLTEVKK